MLRRPVHDVRMGDKRRNWTREETLEALALYLRTPFGRLHERNPDIIRLAERLGRTPGAVTLKACNFAALDESLPRKGMAHASRIDREVWETFRHDPEILLPVFARQTGMEEPTPGLAEDAATPLRPAPETTERIAPVRQRLGQTFFRRMVLAAWAGRCPLTGVNDARLLNASHIVAWKDDPANRLNPRNGICLNTLHDRAFDRHLITFDEDMRLVIAPDVPDDARRVLEQVDSLRLSMPERFRPDPALLDAHRRRFHQRLRAAT